MRELGDAFLDDAADRERDLRDAGEPDRDLEFLGEPDRDRATEPLDPERDLPGDEGALDNDLDRDRDPAGDLDFDRERDLEPEATDLDRDLEPPEPERDRDRLPLRSLPDPLSSPESLSDPILLRFLDPPSLSLPLAIFSLSSSLSSDDETNLWETIFCFCFWESFSEFRSFSFFFLDSPFSFLRRSLGLRSFPDFRFLSPRSCFEPPSPPSLPSSLPESDRISPSSRPFLDFPDAKIQNG